METYYQLIDRDSSTVSSLWKGIHIASLALVIGSDFITANTFGKALEYFGNNCFLHANIVFGNTSKANDSKIRALDSYRTHPIDVSGSKWSTQEECYFCQFTPVMSMICAIIWCTFFIMCSKGGAGYISDSMYRPWRLVYPALVFAIVSVGITLISTVHMSDGITAFCAQFKPIFNSTKCTTAIDDYTHQFHVKGKKFVIRLQLSIIFSFLSCIGWMIQLVTLILRIFCVTDFQMMRITVTTGDDTEEILDVIDPKFDGYDGPIVMPIPGVNEDVNSKKSTLVKKPQIQTKKHLALLDHRRRVPDLDQEPPTDSSYITSSPDLSQGDVPDIIPEDRKENTKQPTHSFSAPPQGDALSTNLGKDTKVENILLSVLNEKPISENHNTATDHC